MKTPDLIALLGTITAVTDIVGDKICNGHVPTKDATTGELDVPFVWVQFRNDLPFTCQNPSMGTQPLGKVFDVEAVAANPADAETLREAIYSAHGYSGAAGTAVFDLLTIADQSDDYLVRNASDDAGVYVDSLLVQVVGE